MTEAANDLSSLRKALEHTLSPYSETRKNAENILRSFASRPNYMLLLIQVLESDQEDPQIRLAASLVFKNFAKANWDPEKQGCIPENEKQIVKQHLVNLICRMPDAIKKQLSEALATIGGYDFPHQWDYLLKQLVEKLQQEKDWGVRNGVLMTANTIFKRFRNAFKSDGLFLELKHCLEDFQAPLLQLFKQTGLDLRSPVAGDADQVQMLRALRTMCRIFYSLNWQDIPEFFEDHIAEWMEGFLSYFSYENPALAISGSDDDPDPLDLLLVAIVDNINLYAEKYDEEFKPFLQKFTEVIWHLLAQRVSLKPKHDDLAATSMRFLTSIASRAHNRALFESPEVLARLCDIVIINLTLRTADEELFEDNPMEYIRRDIEGSDGDSRRSAARDLIRGLLYNFSEDVTRLCMNAITIQLQSYKSNPSENWLKKDVSINLFIALAAIRQSRLQGVSEVNPRAPLMDFFMAEVLPELQSSQSSMVLKADAIKLVATFRVQLPITATEALYPLLLESLDPSQFVVHTYAASCIERILCVKDGSTLRFNQEKLAPHLATTFEKVFIIFEQPSYPENDYLMKLIMRLVHVAKTDILPLTESVLAKLTQILIRISSNPSNPSFSHYLFESISVLISNVSKANHGAIAIFETLLVPPFQKVLANDVDALSPYVYQVLAQILELREQGVSPPYMTMFPILLSPGLWDKMSNAPAIVKLLEAYMRKATTEIAQSVQGILGVFQKLISARSSEIFAFSLLRALIGNMPYSTYSNYFNEILKILMIRLQTRISGRGSTVFVKDLIYTLSIFISKQGPSVLIDALESLQQGMSVMLLDSIWAEHVIHVSGILERKACIIALTRLICETQLCCSQGQLWSKLLGAAISILETPDTTATAKDEEEALQELEQVGYEAGYSKLYFAAVAPSDYLSEYGLPQQYLIQKLASLSQTHPGKYTQFVVEFLPEPSQKLLQAYFVSANLAFH